MGSRGRPLFDLNEPPAEEEEDKSNDVLCSQPQTLLPTSSIQPQKLLPTANSTMPIIFPLSIDSDRIQNNHAFTHASVGSGFQPFVRVKDGHILKGSTNKAIETKDDSVQKANERKEDSAQKANERKEDPAQNPNESESGRPSSSMAASQIDGNTPVAVPHQTVPNSQEIEKEEGEWSDMEDNDLLGASRGPHGSKYDVVGADESVQAQRPTSNNENTNYDKGSRNSPSEPDSYCIKGDTGGVTMDANDCAALGAESSRNSDGNSKGDLQLNGAEEPSVAVKPKDVKGVEASHALRFGNNLAKRPKLDEQKEAMLGKKRNRQTVFLNINEVKQVGPMKSSTPKRQTFSSTLTSRTVKETFRSNSATKQVESLSTDNTSSDATEPKLFSNGDLKQGQQDRSKKLNSNNEPSIELQDRTKKSSSNNELSTEIYPTSSPSQGSWKQSAELRHLKNQLTTSKKPSILGQNMADQKTGNKKHAPNKKQSTNSFLYQDTSVERLLREVTNEKFWLYPEEAELQCVPGQFESVEDYVRVFEPLLLEECRAQLYSTWEESTEHIMVRVKNVERRERGWYDVIMLPPHEVKWTFKEGDVAVLSSPRPGAVRLKRNSTTSTNEEETEPEINGRVAGTVRRHSPIDTRDFPGAILHFYVGDTYDSSSKADDHILKKFQPRSVWYLTVLGSLATTQREYVALHAFRRLNMQMQTAILKPSPEHFPKYEERPPAMPECFTQSFIDHLHRTFNGPQLAAIQWAAMHTAAGTSGATKKQDPWPFTLVQGPPGTGKTHTVWGMLNVIHLVQYQHYYSALLKKLAPESYRQPSENNYESAGTGSIDEVLHNMDQNLFRTLPKLCPKPRMLVCAPSNAATDELLARVLNRGFIDGEMKIYRPDVARVGVDSQTRAAQAVSVEQRTNLLLEKGREEVVGWMQNLRAHEAHCAQRIALLQRQLNAAAAVGRSQGSVGIDPEVLVARDQNRDALLQELAQIVEQRDKILVEMSRLLIVEGKFHAGYNFNIEEARANLEASFANEAEIVFTTVSSSGRKLFSRLTHGFDMIVIDEAAQASEVGVLPPLSLGAARCVLVGDPQQLPATVISKAAGTLLYSRSLFERFQQAGCPTMLLSVQYRMHPKIRDFPSRYFYQGRLSDSECVANLPDEIYYKDLLLQPYIFFDIMHGRESHKAGSVSYQNIHEAQFCLRLYEHLQNFVKTNGGNKVSVGIITPYKLQLRCIEREFEQVLKSEEGKDLYINTVDAFQGQERDVIIMSCVRASSHGVGFVADIRRMNVALTRARRALWVVGNANALMQSEDWAALITDAKSRKCFMDLNSIPKEFLVLKGSSYTPSKGTSNLRGPRMFGQRQRNFDTFPEPKSGTPSEEDEKPNAQIPRNGSYRSLKSQIENSLDDLGQSSEKSRDAWQYGTVKRTNSSNMSRREL